uniref:Ribosomal protein S9 n=1 Tax=Nitzschia sp. PL3-2 TaxID=2083271 RepID=A0A2Z5ZAS3_9STRA|nr:ribosomal protein S9 [Nitzschia sp. PL3-2]
MLDQNIFRKNFPVKIINIGKRKESIAHVYLFSGKGRCIINKTLGRNYLQDNIDYLKNIRDPLKILNIEKKVDLIIFVKGGGLAAQSKAIQLAIVKHLYYINKNNKKILKFASLITRDSRIKERKKYGLKKARKAPQYSKR